MNQTPLGSGKRRYDSIIRYLFGFVIVTLFILYCVQRRPNPSPQHHFRGNVFEHVVTEASLTKTTVDHLIIVPGHSVLRVEQLNTAHFSENAWYLLPYQLQQDFAKIIYSHIVKGVEIAKSDKNSLLIFSGGQTRLDVGPTSEAASYYYVAKYRKLFNMKSRNIRPKFHYLVCRTNISNFY